MSSNSGRPPRQQVQHPDDESPLVVFSDEGREWNQTVTRLMEVGFPLHDAALWEIAREPSRDNDALTVHAASYRAAGFTAAEAVEWFCHGIDPVDAVDYALRGWDPGQARMLRRLLCEADGDSRPPRVGGPFTESHIAETWWLLRCIPPERVLRYVAAGYNDREASILERRHQRGDETVDPAVDMLVAMRLTPAPRA